MVSRSRSLSIALAITLGFGFVVADLPTWPNDPVESAIASSSCESTTPSLQNGSFENIPNVASFSSPINGGWHGYGGGPAQVLFLNQNDAQQVIQGWKTTAGDQMLEIQRQVAPFIQDGTKRGSGYFDTHNIQAAHGQYWAEINANNMAAFYQDIEAAVGQTYYWSIKHRGRQFSQNATDQMLVKIGPPGALVQQTGVSRFRPTNDVYTSYPVYGSPDTESVTIFRTALEDGWVKYQGSYVPTQSETIRFQFEAATGGSVGNFIDDLQFTVFKACTVEVAVSAGTEAQLDVTSAAISLGDNQSLIDAKVVGDIPGTVVVEGDNIRFETEYNGDVDVEYTIGMDFGGATITQTGLITFRVSGGVAPPVVTQDSSPGEIGRFEGPEFQTLPAMNLIPGTLLRVSGVRFNQIRGLRAAGVELPFEVFSPGNMTILIPRQMPIGVFDLEVLTHSSGSLTHMDAIGVRLAPKATSLTTFSKKRISTAATLTHAQAATRQDSALNKLRCIVNSSDLENSRVLAVELCKAVQRRNAGLVEVVIEPRNTVRNEAIYARVYFGLSRDLKSGVWLTR
jgi:hypothetical protein